MLAETASKLTWRAEHAVTCLPFVRTFEDSSNEEWMDQVRAMMGGGDRLPMDLGGKTEPTLRLQCAWTAMFKDSASIDGHR